jgi:hypothetical protein
MISVPSFILTVLAFFGDEFYRLVYLILFIPLLWPLLFFLLGLRTSVREVNEVSNYGIRSALVHACRAGLGFFVCGLLGGILYLTLSSTYDAQLHSLVEMGRTYDVELDSLVEMSPLSSLHRVIYAAKVAMVALYFALIYGGVDVINHYVLRLIVHRNGYAPKKLHRFLDHCTKLIFLRKVGGGYIFIHRLLLEHFAAMWEGGEKDKRAASVRAGSTVAAAT